MSIDTLIEKLYPLAAIRQFLPESARTGKPVHPSVISRWITRGLKVKDGTVVHLEAVKAGNALCTSREAVGRFFAELTARNRFPGNRAAAGRAGNEDTSQRLVELGLKAGQLAARS
jgi:hypothetical protein